MSGSIGFAVAHDPQQWDALVASHPGATGFHDWAWLTLQTELFGWHTERLLVTCDGRPVGVFPVLQRPGRLHRPALPPFPYVGPLVPPELLVDTLRAFRRWQLRHGVPVARFDLGPDALAGTAVDLTRAGVTSMADRTYVVDLVGSSPEQLLAGMGRGARQAYRVGPRKGVQVRASGPGEVAATLPLVLAESYASRGVPSPYPSDIGARIERFAAAHDDVLTSTALVEGEVAGVLVALARHPVLTGWAGGTLRAFRSANPSTSLFHHLLLTALARGHTAVDLVGHVDPGVSRFKLSLGATERPFTTVVSSPLPPAVRSAALALEGALRHRRRGAKNPEPFATADEE